MEPIKVRENASTGFSLWLEAGVTDVDDVIAELEHEPNGYFWEGIAELLVEHEAPQLRGRFEMDPEGGAFVAHGTDRAALEDLAARLTGVATSEARVRELVALAGATGFDFDD